MSDHHDGHDHDHIHPAPTTFLSKYVFSIDHKVIAVQFLLAAMFFVVYGASLALAVRYQIAWPQQNVPYHAILPGKEGTPTAMTSRVPEGNIALWKKGGDMVTGSSDLLLAIDPAGKEKPFVTTDVAALEEHLKANPTWVGRRIPSGTKATFAGLPQGLAVTLPANTLVRDASGGADYPLTEPTNAIVPEASVMGDYQHTTAPAARTVAGTTVTVKSSEAESTITLAGSRVHRATGDGAELPVRIDEVIMPIRGDATIAAIDVPDQTITVGARQDRSYLEPNESFDILDAAVALNALRAAVTPKEPPAGSDIPKDALDNSRAPTADEVEKIAEAQKAVLSGAELQRVTAAFVKARDEAKKQALAGATPEDAAAIESGQKKVVPDEAALKEILASYWGVLPETVEVSLAGVNIPEVAAPLVTFQKHWLSDNAYLTLFTMHASIMIFFVLMPTLLGVFANFLIPLMIGARDMAFPKLNMLSFWISVPAGIVILASFWVPGGAAGGGWTMYPPHSNATYSSGLGATLWVIAIGLVGFSTIVGTINYITTIINMRAPGMTMFRMPLTAWSLFVTAILALFATPVLTAAAILLLFDRVLGTLFFVPRIIDAAGNVVGLGGGQPLLWQHLFWFFGHPEVYILILPAMGIASEVLSVHARKPVFGYKPMVFALAAIGGLGFIVWGHHMFQSGMNPLMGTTFAATTIMIAVPSAIKTFNWLGTIWGGNIRFTPAMLFALGFVSMFVIGGLSGIFMASASVDVQLHDTYFIVAHIHYVFFGGTLFAIFAGIYHWYPKMFGRQMNQRWGVIHFILSFIAFNGTFFLMHVLGIGGHPRRYASIMWYPSLEHLQPMNVVMTIFALMLGVSQFPFIYNFFVSMPRRLGRNATAMMAIMLLAPMSIGGIYWGGFQGGADAGWWSTLLYWVWGGGAGQWVDTQLYAAYIFYFALVGWLFYVHVTQLPRGGKIASLICFGLLILVSLLAIGKGMGQTNEQPVWQLVHDIIVSVGLATPAMALLAGLVFGTWFVGGMIGVPAIINRALYVVMPALFLMPVFLKHDFFMWIGMPDLFEMRWLLVGLCLLPGAAYVALARPRDAYGQEASVNPWHANSLEWTIPSPPPHHNFDVIPTVYRGPYEYCSPVVEEDYLPQWEKLPEGVVEPAGH